AAGPGGSSGLHGGGARTIGRTLARFGLRPASLTAIGRDPEGDELVASCNRLGLVTDHVYRSEDLPTDRYMAVEGGNGLIAAIADAPSLEAARDKILRPLADGTLATAPAPWAGPVALDGNLTQALLADIAASPLFSAADLRVAPASPGKAERLLPLLPVPRATLYVNLEEAGLLCQRRFASAPEAAAGLVARGACPRHRRRPDQRGRDRRRPSHGRAAPGPCPPHHRRGRHLHGRAYRGRTPGRVPRRRA